MNKLCEVSQERRHRFVTVGSHSGWFTLGQANVSFDHPFDAPLEHALNIDFVNESLGASARGAVELSEEAARELVRTILSVLEKAGTGGHLA